VALVGLAHTAVCVPDADLAVAWYRDTLGMKVLSPPYLMSGADIEKDMGELLPGVELKAAIVGFDRSDRVIELIEYPRHAGQPVSRRLADHGLSHVGLVCEDLAETRADLEQKGVAFLTSGPAQVAGLRTDWFQDPYGVVFILMEKSGPDRPYWRQ
jgi:catechol 2,3-dioxygenase-like lactoylglutathione lyase family enzyme